MKDKKLKKGIDEIKMIKMTDFEKNRIFENIINTSSKAKTQIRSPWFFYSFVFSSNKSKLVYYVVIPLIMILSFGGVVFASQESLPNSVLYPIKTNILEPVQGILIFSQIDKAKHESSLAKKRLVEAQVLAEQGSLDVKTENKIKNLISSHTSSLNNAINKVNSSDSKKEVEDITTNFRAEMHAHSKILNNIVKHLNYKKDESNNKKNIDNDVFISESDVVISTPISEAAKSSAEKVKINSSKKINNKNNYKNKQEEVLLLIDKTSNLISFDSSIDYAFDEKKYKETHEAINKAKKYFENADKMKIEGKIEDAYESLLDSESSLKEANIVIKNQESKEDKDRD